MNLYIRKTFFDFKMVLEYFWTGLCKRNIAIESKPACADSRFYKSTGVMIRVYDSTFQQDSDTTFDKGGVPYANPLNLQHKLLPYRLVSLNDLEEYFVSCQYTQFSHYFNFVDSGVSKSEVATAPAMPECIECATLLAEELSYVSNVGVPVKEWRVGDWNTVM